jgi:hypothetical protein
VFIILDFYTTGPSLSDRRKGGRGADERVRRAHLRVRSPRPLPGGRGLLPHRPILVRIGLGSIDEYMWHLASFFSLFFPFLSLKTTAVLKVYESSHYMYILLLSDCTHRVDKFELLKVARTPPRYTDSLIRPAYYILLFFTCVHCAVGGWMHGAYWTRNFRDLAQEYVKKLGTADIPSSYTNGVSFVNFWIFCVCFIHFRI